MQRQIADTPKPPYYAVIFTSVRGDIGLTVCYWTVPESIRNWRADVEHAVAQRLGRERWYATYRTRICRVESERGR